MENSPDHRGIAGYAPIAPKPRLRDFMERLAANAPDYLIFKMKAFILHDDPIPGNEGEGQPPYGVQSSRLGAGWEVKKSSILTAKISSPVNTDVPLYKESNLTRP